MSDLSTTRYFDITSHFLQALAEVLPHEGVDPEEGIVEFAAGNLMIRIAPHLLDDERATEPDAMNLEADLMLLDLENRGLNHDRFLILHQLNAVTRLSTGITAFISDEGMLTIGKIVSLASFDEEELANEVTALIEAGNHLYDGWNHLADQGSGASDESEVQQESDADFSIDELA